MSRNAFSIDSLDVFDGKASRTASGDVERIVEMTDCRFSGWRASSATARLPCEGEERIRAMPVPWIILVRQPLSLLSVAMIRMYTPC